MSEPISNAADVSRLGVWQRARGLHPAAPIAIILLATGLRIANIRALGYVNHYYTAAVASMLQSWHNFFFVAAEPGAAVSVDKPPIGLWLQTGSAYLLGVNGLGVLLPQILAGILSVALLYHLVRRWFGTAAGLLAALALAITPVAVATDRNNTIDSTLVMTLLLAAWAFSRAVERGQARFVLLGAGLVGAGFNIKMLEAFLPLPSFYALYLLGSREALGRKAINLVLATGLLAFISLAWITAVDLTPADQRPYIINSGSNSELDLAFGYNGLQRLAGLGRSLQGGVIPLLDRLLTGDGGRHVASSGLASGEPGVSARLGPDGATEQESSDNSQPGLARLFTPPLSKEASWLLPFGLIVLALLAGSARLQWPLARPQQAAVLWGGWLATGVLFFSVAGFFHEYYLSIIGPPVAALFGIGALEIWRLGRARPWLAIGLLLIAASFTLALQYVTATWFAGFVWWLVLSAALMVVGAGVLLGVTGTGQRRASLAGFSCVMAALLVTPGIWAASTTANAKADQTLPAAYDGRPSGGVLHGALHVDQRLLSYLQTHTAGQQYLVAVPSSAQGSDYVIATGRPVLYLGGFMGYDPVVTPDGLSRLVASRQLRFVYWDTSGRVGLEPKLTTWLADHCQVVPGFDSPAANSGTQDGAASGTAGEAGLGGARVSLYDCGR